jgi:hypothetical protein
MRRTQRSDHRVDTRWQAQHLDAVFLNLLEAPTLTEKRISRIQRPELSMPQGLPAAFSVVADCSCTGFEYRSLDRFQVTLGHVEAQFLHERSACAA